MKKSSVLNVIVLWIFIAIVFVLYLIPRLDPTIPNLDHLAVLATLFCFAFFGGQNLTLESQINDVDKRIDVLLNSVDKSVSSFDRKLETMLSDIRLKIHSLEKQNKEGSEDLNVLSITYSNAIKELGCDLSRLEKKCDFLQTDIRNINGDILSTQINHEARREKIKTPMDSESKMHDILAIHNLKKKEEMDKETYIDLVKTRDTLKVALGFGLDAYVHNLVLKTRTNDMEKLTIGIKNNIEACQQLINVFEQAETVRIMSEPLDISDMIQDALRKKKVFSGEKEKKEKKKDKE